MEFTNRSAQPAQGSHATATAPSGHTAGGGKLKRMNSDPAWLRVVTIALLFSISIIAVGVLFLLYNGSPNESKYLNNKGFQAVFLTNGQVYFGKIQSISQSSLDLRSIYYLSSQAAQPENKDKQTQANNFSLVKLGCELHGPLDQMILNREQITFWENIKDDGQVVQAINKWQQQNPDGQQTCKTAPDQANTNSVAPKP